MNDHRLQKRRAVNATDTVASFPCGAAPAVTESLPTNQLNEHESIAVGSDLTKKTCSYSDQKRSSPYNHTISSSKLTCNNYKNNFDDVGLPSVKVCLDTNYFSYFSKS